VVDATGATRTMLGGVVRAMAADKLFEGRYRDAESGWLALRVVANGQLESGPLAQPVPPDVTDFRFGRGQWGEISRGGTGYERGLGSNPGQRYVDPQDAFRFSSGSVKPTGGHRYGGTAAFQPTTWEQQQMQMQQQQMQMQLQMQDQMQQQQPLQQQQVQVQQVQQQQ
jgi:hypothetical protein